MSLVYLAGPIDQVSIEAARGWRRSFTNHLMNPPGLATVFDPAAAFTVLDANKPHDLSTVIAIDDFALSKADVVVVLRKIGAASKGTDREISAALTRKTPIVVYAVGYWVSEIRQWLLRLGATDESLSLQVLHICSTLRSAVDATVETLGALS